MHNETSEQELERRRLVESVERSLRFRYAVIGAIAIAVLGLLISASVNQFTRDARMEFAASKAVNEQATSFLLEARKQSLEALENAERVRQLVDRLQQDERRIQEEMADIQSQNLQISDAMNRELDSLRQVVNDIAQREDGAELEPALDTIQMGVIRTDEQIQQLLERVRRAPIH